MRILAGPDFVTEMKNRRDATPDCFVRPGEYQHHMYINGVKYVVAHALKECLQLAEKRADHEALLHLRLHEQQFKAAMAAAGTDPQQNAVIGPPPPAQESLEQETLQNSYCPPEAETFDDLGISMTFFIELVLRTIYNRGRMAASEIAESICVPFGIVNDVLPRMRQQGLIDLVAQRQGAIGDAGSEYEIKPPKGADAVADALKKTEYVGPLPVPFDQYVKTVNAQTIKGVEVTRNNIERAFQDLVITPEVFNEIGPAVNSAASIFLFGFPGNGKTSIAERVTRLMGGDIYIPYAVEANGQIIKVFDKILHEPVSNSTEGVNKFLRGSLHDERYIKIKRPTIVVGGELTLPMLDLKYNEFGKFYEAPLQMKANGGMFMIDDFGRQQVRPMDLLNRWIVPLEKKYDYLTTVNGMKIEVPFDQLLVFSTNLDPTQLADEAFLRRIKFKIEVRDPDQRQWRQIWEIMCNARKIKYDDRGVTYLVEKHFKPTNRPFRMCQPRDIIDQMISIAKYNMEEVTFSPDLIDAAAATYFVDNEKRDFGAAVRLD